MFLINSESKIKIIIDENYKSVQEAECRIDTIVQRDR